jgi:hypothetical protein
VVFLQHPRERDVAIGTCRAEPRADFIGATLFREKTIARRGFRQVPDHPRPFDLMSQPRGKAGRR